MTNWRGNPFYYIHDDFYLLSYLKISMKKEFCRNFYECEMKRISLIIGIRRKSEITLCLVELETMTTTTQKKIHNKTKHGCEPNFFSKYHFCIMISPQCFPRIKSQLKKVLDFFLQFLRRKKEILG